MSRYDRLFEPIQLGNGVQLRNRLMLAPMCDDSANNGQVTHQQNVYIGSRSKDMGIAVTGYAYVDDSGDQLPGQLSVAHDDDIQGISQLATMMKNGGAKAILQLSHAGRGAGASARNGQRVYAPSKLPFPWLDYDVEEMSSEDIEAVITDFGEATKRAIAAGFDEVEIHDCNHDLLQQFFSASSNQRSDKWGGTLTNRMAFPLAVLREVKQVIAKSGNQQFILGWRISPEEKHGDKLGYSVHDMWKQTKKVAALGVDYLNISLNLSADYSNRIRPSYDVKVKGTDQSFPTYYRSAVGSNVPIFIGSNVLTADDALAAVQDADGVYVGREMLIDPDFVNKIRDNKTDNIINSTTIQHLRDVQLPDGFVENYADKDGSDRIVSYRNGIPLPGLD